MANTHIFDDYEINICQIVLTPILQKMTKPKISKPKNCGTYWNKNCWSCKNRKRFANLYLRN